MVLAECVLNSSLAALLESLTEPLAVKTKVAGLTLLWI